MTHSLSTRQWLVVWSIAGLLFSACSAPAPQPITYGEDSCDYCNMTIMERGFGCELVTNKGKVFKFDAIECLAAFRRAGKIAPDDVHSHWVADYNGGGSFINGDQAYFVYSKQIRSPMAGGLCAVADHDTAVRVRDAHKGRLVTWNEVCDIVGEAWNITPQNNPGT